ncbi:MAG: TlpA disulfide reductase family protein [Acidimicrobiia bacterium]|nr:TlpA disulfide reductase family protein [Acidimicrobiia bacterium]
MELTISRRQRRGIIGGALAVLAVVIVALAVGGDDSPTEAVADDVPATVDSELPTDSFELFAGGDATFAAFEGEPLVINFWASWCPACVGELPDFQLVHEERGDEVTFLGIANADVRDAAVGLADDVGLTYDLADDPAGDLFRQFGLIAMPSTLFVSPDGRIIDVFAGQLTESALDERIDALVAAS